MPFQIDLVMTPNNPNNVHTPPTTFRLSRDKALFQQPPRTRDSTNKLIQCPKSLVLPTVGKIKRVCNLQPNSEPEASSSNMVMVLSLTRKKARRTRDEVVTTLQRSKTNACPE